MLHATCVCAASDIIKITQIIAETTVFCGIKPLLASYCGDIFPLNAAREPFFVKMWPAYETEFETPGLQYETNFKAT
jgi:hypothetical protein